jgi:hypothetical protein
VTLNRATELDLHYVRRFSDKCCAEVSRRGESQACDKTAVAVTVDADQHWWPVCAFHTRGRYMVPLSDLLAALSCSPLEV